MKLIEMVLRMSEGWWKNENGTVVLCSRTMSRMFNVPERNGSKVFASLWTTNAKNRVCLMVKHVTYIDYGGIKRFGVQLSNGRYDALKSISNMDMNIALAGRRRVYLQIERMSK